MYPTNLKTERGTGNNDVTHRFIASGLWNLDAYTGRIQNGFAKRVVGGWLAMLAPPTSEPTWRSPGPRSVKRRSMV